MLAIISKNTKWEILSAFGSMLKNFPGIDVQVFESIIEYLNHKELVPSSHFDPNAWVDLEATTPALRDVVLALGPQSIAGFHEAGLLKKNLKTIDALRTLTHVVAWGDMQMVEVRFTYNIGIVHTDYTKFVSLMCDVSQCLRLYTTGTADPIYGQYAYVTSLQGIRLGIQNLIEAGITVDLAIDTETKGLDRFHPDGFIISIQFSWSVGSGFMVAWPTKEESEAFLHDISNQEDLLWLLNCQQIRTCGANFKYDLEWIYEHTGIECTNFRFDTTMVGSLLDENRSNALDVHVKMYVPHLGGYSDVFDKTADKSKMDLVYQKSPVDFLKYSCGDVDGCLQVKHAQRTELLSDGPNEALAGFYVHIGHPGIRVMEKVERQGVLVDMDAYKELEADLKTELLQSIADAKKIMGGILCAKHYDPDKLGGLNLDKPNLIKDFMFSPHGLNLKPLMTTAKNGEASTAKEHLELFSLDAKAGPYVEVMKKYTAAQRVLTNYVYGFQKHIRSDGKFHPTYYMFAGDKYAGEGGTNTGRLSVRDPAFQTIPKHGKWGKRIRRCFNAPHGYLILEADYSQGELKVIACLAYETNMIKAYADGLDLHVVTGGTVGGYSYEQMLAMKAGNEDEVDKFDALRQLAKAGNFGLIYGMGVDGFIEYAKASYGVNLSKAEASEFRKSFFELYPNLLLYHDIYKKFAKKNGYVASPLGRIRHLPLINSGFSEVSSQAERQAINSPVQGCLSDMMVWAVAIQQDMGWFHNSPCFGLIHDAGYFLIPENNPKFYANRIIEVMENLPFDKVNWTPQLKFTADGKLGKNMGELSSLSKW